MVKEQAREQMGKQAGAGEAGIMYRRIGNTLFKYNFPNLVVLYKMPRKWEFLR